MDKKIITRFAPSPTGNLHVGSARTALFNWLFARTTGGKFIVRIEDTDKERSTKEFEENIFEGLEWLGLSFDETYRQSERAALYHDYLEKLLESGKAYVSKEPSRSDPSREVELVRLKNPGRSITFTDMVRGDITFDTTELGDMIIARGMDDPLYHCAVVIDDFDMQVSHVIRGEDHISNTPRQILIQEALGAPRTVYAHIPLILAPDRSKLSKRKGALSVGEYRGAGYLPEALINYLALLGWNPGSAQEIFSLDELIATFSLENIQKGGAMFDITKLDWMNREHLKRLTDDALSALVETRLDNTVKTWGQYSKKRLYAMLPMLRERVHTLSDIEAMAQAGELRMFFETPGIVSEKLLWKESSPAQTCAHIQYALSQLNEMEDADFTQHSIKNVLWDYATREGRGAVLWPVRYALSGREQSPSPFELAEILGKEETLRRLKNALSLLQQL
jgi:glutamyl-tRNA synthetase